MTHDSVSIVAAGHTPFGRLDGRTLEDLIVQVSREALADAAIDASEIDALFLGHFNAGMVPDAFPASLLMQADPGLRFKPATRCENACASGSAAIQAGINAILSGAAELVLVVGAEKMTHNSTAEVTQALAGAGYQNDVEEAGLSFPSCSAWPPSSTAIAISARWPRWPPSPPKTTPTPWPTLWRRCTGSWISSIATTCPRATPM